MLTNFERKSDSQQINDEDKREEICLCQSLLDGCKLPLIGLQYVTEFQHKTNGLSTLCVCNLCEVKFSFKLIISHVTTMKHRLHYMKERFMNYHTLIYQQARSNADKTALSVEYAQCIEDEEGRQKMKVKIVNSTSTDAAAGKKRPAECDDTTHPVSSKARKVANVKALIATQESFVTNGPTIPRPVRPQEPTSLRTHPIPAASPRPTRPYGLAFVGRPSLQPTPREPFNNVRQPSPQTIVLKSALRKVTPGTPTSLLSSPSQPLSNNNLQGLNANRINFVGKTTSANDMNKSDSDAVHTNQETDISTPASRSVENYSETELSPRSPRCVAKWSPSALPKKSCLKSSAAVAATSNSSEFEVSPGSSHPIQPSPSVDASVKSEQNAKSEPRSEPRDVHMATVHPTHSSPPPPLLASPPPLPVLPQPLPALHPPLPASPPPLPVSPPLPALPPPVPALPQPLPASPPRSPPPPVSAAGSSQLEASPSSRSTLHLHPGFARLMAMMESPPKSPVSSSSPPLRSSDTFQNQSSLTPSSPSLSSVQLPQAKRTIHPSTISTSPNPMSTVQSGRSLYPAFAGRDVCSKSSSAIKAFSGAVRTIMASQNVTQSNANLAHRTERPISSHVTCPRNANPAMRLTQSTQNDGNLPVTHQRPSPASQSSSAPNASHSDLLSVLSVAGLKLLRHVSSRPLPLRTLPTTSQCRSSAPPRPELSSGNSSRSQEISREHERPSQPYPQYSSSLPSRSPEVPHNQSPLRPPLPLSFSSGQLPQTQRSVHPGFISTLPNSMSTVQNGLRLYPPFVQQDVHVRSNHAVQAFPGDMRPSVSNNNIPQSRFQLPSTHNQHPTQFHSVPGTRFNSPPQGPRFNSPPQGPRFNSPPINSGAHPTNCICPPHSQLPHDNLQRNPTYGTSHQTRFLVDTCRSVCDGNHTNSSLYTSCGLLKQYSEAAGTFSGEQNLLPVGIHPHPRLVEFPKTIARFPLEQPHPGSTVSPGNLPSGIRPFWTAQPVGSTSMSCGLLPPHTTTTTSNSQQTRMALRDPRTLARSPMSSAHPQQGPVRNAQPCPSLRQESPKENTVPRSATAQQTLQGTIGRYHCDSNLQKIVNENSTTATDIEKDSESTRTNPVLTLTATKHQSVSNTTERPAPESSLSQDNASLVSNALAKALVEYKMKQKSDKKIA